MTTNRDGTGPTSGLLRLPAQPTTKTIGKPATRVRNIAKSSYPGGVMAVAVTVDHQSLKTTIDPSPVIGDMEKTFVID